MDPHANADHDHAHAADPFPRHETADLIARELAARTARERWQPWLIALGITLVALAFPTHWLIGDVRELVTATESGHWLGLDLVPCALATLLTHLGLPAEQAWYLLSAVFLGLTFIALVSIADDRGWERAPGLLVALVIITSPLAWFAGTLPGTYAAQLCGACLLGAALARRNSTTAARMRAWYIACLLSAANLILFLPLVVSLWRDRMRLKQEHKNEHPVEAALACVIVFGLALGVWSVLSNPLGRFDVRTEVGGFDALQLLPGTATFAVGVGMLVVLRRGRTERWPWAFVVSSLFEFGALFVPGAQLVAIALAPVAMLGWLEFVQRADERSRGAAARLVAALFIVLGVLGTRWLAGQDPRRAWRDTTAEALEPGDIVLSGSAEHLYLLEHRFRVETVDLRSLSHRDDDQRRSFWSAQREHAHALQQTQRRLVIDATPIKAWGWRSTSDSNGPPDIDGELERFASENALPILPLDRASSGTGK